MKVRGLVLIFMFVMTQMLVLTSCEEAPRDRPTFNYSSSNLGGTGGTTEPEPTTLEIPTRPNDEININSGFCGCQLGKPVTLGNCQSFCADKNVADETLYVTVSPTSAITGRDDLGSFHSWCTRELVDPNTGEAVATGVGCEIQATDEDGNKGALTITKLTQGSNPSLEDQIPTSRLKSQH